MTPKTLASYGGPHVNKVPVNDPQGQSDAALYDRSDEDVAQATRTIAKARVWFDAIAGAAADLPAASVSHTSLWGNGSAQKPAVSKVSNGVYTITYAVTFTDALGISETVNFTNGHVEAYTPDRTDSVHGRLLSVAANVATIFSESPIGAPTTPADAGSTTALPIKFCVELF